jgi:muconate cycloisomerase
MLAVLDAARHAHSLGLNINLAGKVAETSISSSAVAVLACLVPNINWDVSVTNQYLETDPVTNSLAIKQGRVIGPQGIGLGTEIEMKKLTPFLVD